MGPALIRRYPLRRLLAAAFAATLLLAVVAFGALTYVQVADALQRSLALSLRDQAEAAIGRQVDESLPDVRPPPWVLSAPVDLAASAPQLVQDLGTRDVAVWVLDADGRTLAHGASQPDGPPPEAQLVRALQE